jgi:hypothetical protein
MFLIDRNGLEGDVRSPSIVTLLAIWPLFEGRRVGGSRSLKIVDRVNRPRPADIVKYTRISLGFVRENQRNRLIFLSSENSHSGAKSLFW